MGLPFKYCVERFLVDWSAVQFGGTRAGREAQEPGSVVCTELRVAHFISGKGQGLGPTGTPESTLRSFLSDRDLAL